MSELVTAATLEEFESFVETHPKGHFTQSHIWSLQKPQWKWEALVSRDKEGKIKGAMSVLIRKVPGTPFTLMYCCRGPVCDIDDRDTVADLVDGARGLAKKYKSYTLKIDPDVPVENTVRLPWQMNCTSGFPMEPITDLGLNIVIFQRIRCVNRSRNVFFSEGKGRTDKKNK